MEEAANDLLKNIAKEIPIKVKDATGQQQVDLLRSLLTLDDHEADTKSSLFPVSHSKYSFEFGPVASLQQPLRGLAVLAVSEKYGGTSASTTAQRILQTVVFDNITKKGGELQLKLMGWKRDLHPNLCDVVKASEILDLDLLQFPPEELTWTGLKGLTELKIELANITEEIKHILSLTSPDVLEKRVLALCLFELPNNASSVCPSLKEYSASVVSLLQHMEKYGVSVPMSAKLRKQFAGQAMEALAVEKKGLVSSLSPEPHSQNPRQYCVRCLAEKPDIVCLPCGHQSTCLSCQSRSLPAKHRQELRKSKRLELAPNVLGCAECHEFCTELVYKPQGKTP